MRVEYKTKKDLPCNELYQLFLAVGWAKEDETTQAIFDLGVFSKRLPFAYPDGSVNIPRSGGR